MSQDAFGNYIPDVESRGEISEPDAQLLSGSGAPGASLGSNGSLYVDIVAGDVYKKFGDTWVVFTGGAGSGVQLVRYTSGDPANPPDTSLPALAYDPTGALPLKGWDSDTLTWT